MNDRYRWSQLNLQQVGTYTEYFVKMELTMYGFQVYTTEVDNHGIDFVARHGRGAFLEIQVKSLRVKRGKRSGYVFVEKDKFTLADNLNLALGLLSDGFLPDLFLIPSVVWKTPNKVFVSRDYEGLKSKPEWGINISERNIQKLEPFRFDLTVRDVCQRLSKYSQAISKAKH